MHLANNQVIKSVEGEIDMFQDIMEPRRVRACLFSALHFVCATEELEKGGQPERLKRRGEQTGGPVGRGRVCSWQKLPRERGFKFANPSLFIRSNLDSNTVPFNLNDNLGD